MKLIFCADKHQSFLQVDTITSDWFTSILKKRLILSDKSCSHIQTHAFFV